MKFTENLDQFKFEDRHEVVFERVKIGSNIEKVDIFMDNIDPTIENVFRIEECEFPGINDVTSSSDNGRDVFKLDIIQVNVFQKPSFLHQLTHNMTRDCSLNSPRNTSSEHVV